MHTQPSAGVFNAFSATESDTREAADDDERRRRVAQDAARSVRASEVARAHEQALAQDASVFEYDGVYDALSSERRDSAARRRAQREAEKQQPKYIATLLQKAKIREIENERIRERRLLNERRADDALYADKEKLVSASYKRKLQEQRQWDEEDARLDALEDAEDVTKRGEHAMAGFYANLLSKNLAMGGSTANATSAYTVRDADRKKEGESEEPSEKKRRRDAVEPKQQQQQQPSSSPSRPPTSSSPPPAPAAAAAAPVRAKEAETKPSKEEVISAAKARFLARKAQREQAAVGSSSSNP